MSFPDQKKTESIKQVFGKYPGGVTISEISSRMKMNRNLVAKYLDFLVLSGQLEMKSVGSAKQYSLSRRIPISALIAFSSDLILMLDDENRILKVNDQLLGHVGEKRTALIGKKIRDVENPFISGLAMHIKSLHQDTGSTQDIAITGKVQGEQNHYTLKIIPIVFEEGTQGTALILHNVTADRKYRQMQDMTMAQHESRDEDQTEFIIRFLPDGSLNYMNRAFCRFFNGTRSECIGRPFRSLIPVEDQRVLESALCQLTRDTPVTTISCRIISSNGQVRYNEWTLRALFDETEKLHEYQGVGRDITDMREAAEKINKNIADQWFLYRSSHLFANLPDDADIYDTIARGASEILPDTVIAVNTVDPAFSTLTTRSFLGEKDRNVFSQMIGTEIIGKVMEAPDCVEKDHVIQNLLGGKLVKVPGNLSVMMMGMIPLATCEKIEEALNLGEMYVLGLVSQNVLFGNLAIMLRKGDTLKCNVVLETFAHLASLELRCRLAEEAMRGKDHPER